MGTTKTDKKVTWSENLINVKMMTPQTSVIENLTDIVIEEEEENYIEVNEPTGFSQPSMNITESSSLSIQSQNIDKSSKQNIQDTHRSLEKSLQQIFGTNVS